MRLQRASDGAVLNLTEDRLIGAGGEARIYAVPPDERWVAKVWHKPTAERAQKLAIMLANPPANPMASQSHCAIAWPSDLLTPPGRPQRVAGFLMPRVQAMRPVGDFFNPKTRRKQCPLFAYQYLHRTARNLATAVRALHERGYVIGDLNESNVLVSDTALVTIVDTDSFQVWDAANARMYRCRVGKPDFTPPELQGRNFSQVDRGPQHDLFGLGVLTFQLLQEGTHPFAGQYVGRGEPPPYEQRIQAGHFPHGNDPRVPYRRSPAAPPFDLLYPGLQHLLVRCFQDGHREPKLRPDAQTWQWLIEEAEKHLLTCWLNSQHLYSDHLGACPWCLRAQTLGGRDPFPNAEAVKRGDHLRPPAPVRGRKGAPGRPAPPVPPPIPPSSSATLPGSLPRALPRGLNDWAWLSFSLSLLALLAGSLLPWPLNLAGWGLGTLGVLCGAAGEHKSRQPELEGRGRWLTRLSLVLSWYALGLCFRHTFGVLL